MHDSALANHGEMTDDERGFWNCHGALGRTVEVHAGGRVYDLFHCPICCWLPEHPGEVLLWNWYMAYGEAHVMPFAGGYNDQPDLFWAGVRVFSAEVARLTRWENALREKKRGTK